MVEENKKGKEEVRVVTKQREIEWDVRKFHWSLYGKHEAMVDKEEILQSIDSLTEMDPEDNQKLECGITEEEVLLTLKNTKNNVVPGPGGFGGAFYKVFWKYLKKIVVNAIEETMKTGKFHFHNGWLLMC